MSKYIKSAILGLGLMIAGSAAFPQAQNWDIDEGEQGEIPRPPRPPIKPVKLMGISYGSIEWKNTFE